MTRGLLIAIILLTGASYLSIVALKTGKEKQEFKDELIELSKIKYGLFNVDEWKKILAQIITKKIDEFNLQGANRTKMKAELETFLYKQINELEQRYYEEKSQSFFGFLVQSPVTVITGVFGKIKKDIPIFTDQILDFLNDQRNRKAIKKYIIGKLNTYADKTFSEMDYTLHNRIISRYGLDGREDTIDELNARIDVLESKSRTFQIGLIIFGILCAIYLMASKAISKNEYMIVTIICFVFLLAGLSLPMIEIDARISKLTFNLLGESVIFQDQVLYYKSKSILEVVKLMMIQRRADLIVVGLLVLTFSVLFPVAKLIASILFIISNRFTSNKVIRFIVFRTGKWSMADVMVIAIFMAYIGFSGIITEQLKQLETLTQNIDILTTNKSSLLTGFYAFTSFAILSLLLSHKLQYGFKRRESIQMES